MFPSYIFSLKSTNFKRYLIQFCAKWNWWAPPVWPFCNWLAISVWWPYNQGPFWEMINHWAIDQQVQLLPLPCPWLVVTDGFTLSIIDIYSKSNGTPDLFDRPTQLNCISDIYLLLFVNRQIQKTLTSGRPTDHCKDLVRIRLCQEKNWKQDTNMYKLCTDMDMWR